MDILGNNPEILFDQDLNTTDDVSFDTVSSNAFIKNGGTDIQYLMADGSVLTSSANSGNSNFYLYNNTNSAVDTTPIAGELIINNASNPLATIVYISHKTRDNIDVEVFWQFINQLTDLYIQDQNLSENYVRYNITGAPTITAGDKIAIPVSYLTSDGTGNTAFGSGHNIMVSYFTNTLETDTRITALEVKTSNQSAVSGTSTTWTGVANFANLNSPIMDSAAGLAFGTNTQTGLTVGRGASATNLRGSVINTTGNILPTVTNVNNIGSGTFIYNTIFGSIIGTNAIDVPVAGSNITIGASSALSITIGRATQTVSFPGSIAGSLTVATSVLTPLINTATAVVMNIGTATQTGLTLGRVAANSLLNGLNVNLGQVPYINGTNVAPTTAQPRLVLAKYIMPVNNTVNVGTVVLNSVAGGMGGLNTVANEILVGTTWRYKFNGFAINAASTNTLSLQLVHNGGTQNLATWTYGVSTPATANFHGEIIMFYTTIGAGISPQVSGHITFNSTGTSISIQNVSVSLFSPSLYSTIVANSNNIQIVASPSTGFQYTVSNFTCEWLR
jgi:hypothetical protein